MPGHYFLSCLFPIEDVIAWHNVCVIHFRVFVPALTWLLSVNVSGCVPLATSDGEQWPCPLELAFRSNALPLVGQSVNE